MEENNNAGVNYDQRINYLLACLGGSSSLSDDFRPYSRIEKMLYANLTNSVYEGPALSRIEKLFMVYLGFAGRSIIDFTPSSRIEEILLSKIDGTTYNQNPLSIAEELLLQLSNKEWPTDAIVDSAYVDHAILAS